MADEEKPIIVVKKVKKVAGGHHGGAWKVAYADFVTAMMAFFLLLWLLNISDAKTLAGLAQYFTPSTASTQVSGAGGVLGGQSIQDEQGAASGAIIQNPAQSPPSANDGGHKAKAGQAGGDEEKMLQWRAREDATFDRAAQELKVAIQQSPELSRHQDQLVVEVTDEGLKIQLIDKDQRPMFRAGTDEAYGYSSRLLAKIAAVIARLDNRVSIAGNTSSVSEGNASNWDLSAERANAARKIMAAAGLANDRVSEVSGKADSDPLLPQDPSDPQNRRISILLLREAPVLAPGYGL